MPCVHSNAATPCSLTCSLKTKQSGTEKQADNLPKRNQKQSLSVSCEYGIAHGRDFANFFRQYIECFR